MCSKQKNTKCSIRYVYVDQSHTVKLVQTWLQRWERGTLRCVIIFASSFCSVNKNADLGLMFHGKGVVRRPAILWFSYLELWAARFVVCDLESVQLPHGYPVGPNEMLLRFFGSNGTQQSNVKTKKMIFYRSSRSMPSALAQRWYTRRVIREILFLFMFFSFSRNHDCHITCPLCGSVW